MQPERHETRGKVEKRQKKNCETFSEREQRENRWG